MCSLSFTRLSLPPLLPCTICPAWWRHEQPVWIQPVRSQRSLWCWLHHLCLSSFSLILTFLCFAAALSHTRSRPHTVSRPHFSALLQTWPRLLWAHGTSRRVKNLMTTWRSWVRVFLIYWFFVLFLFIYSFMLRALNSQERVRMCVCNRRGCSTVSAACEYMWKCCWQKMNVCFY